MDVRSALVASRPEAALYARAIAELPADLAGATGRVAALRVYPVKGLGGVALATARVERRGLVDPATGLADRGVMLACRRAGTTPDGAAFDAVGLANRNEPALALARAGVEDGALVYRAQGLPPLRLPPASLAPTSGARVRVKLPYDGGAVIAAALDEGPLAAWVADLLHAHPGPRRFAPEDVVAVRPLPEHARRVPDKHRAGEDADTLFGDGAHALVASATTLAWMNRALARDGARAIAMEAFRPNVVLDGLPANAEDVIAEAIVTGADGPLPLRFATLCVRCDATRVDYATGKRPDAQPLAWLAKNRPPRDGDRNAATFAVNAVVPAAAHGKRVRVGDALTVARER